MARFLQVSGDNVHLRLLKYFFMLRLIKPAIIVIGFCTFLLTACDKEYSTENGGTPGSGGGGGGTTGCKSCVYQPWCDGSTYTYIDTSFGGSAATSTSTLDIVADTTIDGKVFSKTLAEGNTSYHNCTNGITTVIGYQLPATGGTVEKIVNTFLKENDAVGSTWTDNNVNGTGQTVVYDYEIIAKGFNHTVLGVTYNDVIQVHQTSSIEVPILGNIVTSESDYYYARNIGLIESLITESLTGTMVLHRVLQSYNIP